MTMQIQNKFGVSPYFKSMIITDKLQKKIDNADEYTQQNVKENKNVLENTTNVDLRIDCIGSKIIPRFIEKNGSKHGFESINPICYKGDEVTVCSNLYRKEEDPLAGQTLGFIKCESSEEAKEIYTQLEKLNELCRTQDGKNHFTRSIISTATEIAQSFDTKGDKFIEE